MDTLSKAMRAVPVTCALIVLCASAQAAEWLPMQSGTDYSLYAVWGSSAQQVFAVGKYGTILRYDGSAWSLVDSDTAASLYGIWGESPSDVFAVGREGEVVHYNGSRWSNRGRVTTELLNSVWGTSDENVFAVGDESTIMFYDGHFWSQMDTLTSESLAGIWGPADDEVFAVGDNGRILYYDGEVWSKWPTVTKTMLHAVWGVSETDMFAVGDDGLILHFNGANWSAMESPTSRSLRSVWGSSAEEVFAVGAEGVIVHYDGASWTRMQSGTDATLYAVWVSPDAEAFAVGRDGTVLHYAEAATTTSAPAADSSTTTTAASDTTTVPPDATTTSTLSTTTSIPERAVDFVASPTSGYRPLDVAFTSLCAGDIAAYHWDFGDFQELTGDADPVHTYSEVGTYSVILTVTFADGSEDYAVKENYISVAPRSACLFAQVLQDEGDIRALRRLRDTLARTGRGQELVNIYYDCAPEIIALMKTRPELQARLEALVADNRAGLRKLAAQGGISVSEAFFYAGMLFLEELSDEVSPARGASLKRILHDIKDERLLAELGITVN